MRLLRRGLRAVLAFACVGLAGHSGAQVAPVASPVPSPPSAARYEYDAIGQVTRIVRGDGNAGVSLTYDRLRRITSVTDERGGTTRFEYEGGMPYLRKLVDPRGLETVYEVNGFGDVTRVVSPDTGTTEFTYDEASLPVTMRDSRGVLSRFTHDEVMRLTRIERSRDGRAEAPLTWRYGEVGPEFSYGIGRLTSTGHGAGGSRYRYEAHGEVVRHDQWMTPAPGANAATVQLAVTYGRELGDLASIGYPSGWRLLIHRDHGRVTGLSMASDAAAEPVPLLSGVRWAPFGMWIDGWDWHTEGGVVAHRRSFDLSGRMTRYPIGGVVRDLRYDARDRILSFTHTKSDGTPLPMLDQWFGYDEGDRLASVLTATAQWTFTHDPNGNRSSLGLNAGTSLYDLAPDSNRLQGTSGPARRLEYDGAGNTVSDSQGYRAAYDLAGQLATLTREGVSTTYSYNEQGQRIRKVSSTGPQSTVIFVYDLDGQMLGEYDHEGRAIREYVWLDDVPVAVVVPDPADRSAAPQVFYIHADHLNAPRAVFDRGGRPRWQWLAEPFGTTAPEVDPAGLGVFDFKLRLSGQYADAESGLFYNWNRYDDPRDGRYIQSDPIGLEGGLSMYAYAEGNPLAMTDPTGECPWCIAAAIGGLTDLAIQLYFNGFNLKCVNWKEVAVSAAISGVGIGIAQRFAHVTTAYKGVGRPTYRFFKSKDVLRVESHPISGRWPNWLSYPHWHADWLGKPWSKRHAALIEPLVGASSSAYHAVNDCECQP